MMSKKPDGVTPLWKYVYRLGRADWIAYESRSVELSGWRFLLTLAVPAAMGGAYGALRDHAPGWFPFAADGWADLLVLAALALGIWYIVTTIAMTVAAHRRARRHPLAAIDTTLEVFHDHFAEHASPAPRFCAWEMVTGVRVEPHHVFIQPEGGPVVIVPARAFEDQADMVAFGNWASNRADAAARELGGA